MNFLAIAIGAFYIFAGVVALRALRFDGLMDTVLEALEGKPQSVAGRLKGAILTAGAAFTLASGVALATLSPLAPTLFIVNAIVQGGYLAWAARALPPEDADETKGRRQTQNAFVIYLVATAFVVWLHANGILRPWPAGTYTLSLEGLLVGAITLAGWALMFVPRWSSARDRSIPEAFASPPPPAPVNLRLQPGWQHWPLWDADSGENVSHNHLDLPIELAGRIETWDDSWQETYNGDDPPASGFQTQALRLAYEAQGKRIAAELQRHWKGRVETPDEFR
ncbi:MAG: hypothetical protein SGJ03_01005 [Alphaproteobacteria bacterium]|mgnify:CR=1 FL=1|nr:hypothetical protein [Alphaproteobacteria bacterium]